MAPFLPDLSFCGFVLWAWIVRLFHFGTAFSPLKSKTTILRLAISEQWLSNGVTLKLALFRCVLLLVAASD